MTSPSKRCIDILLQHVCSPPTQSPSTNTSTPLSKKIQEILPHNSYYFQKNPDGCFTFHFSRVCELLSIPISVENLDSFRDVIVKMVEDIFTETNGSNESELEDAISSPMLSLLLSPYLHTDALEDLKQVFAIKSHEDIFMIPSRLAHFVQKHTLQSELPDTVHKTKRRRLESTTLSSNQNFSPCFLLSIYLISRFGMHTILSQTSANEVWNQTKAANWKKMIYAIHKSFPEEDLPNLRAMIVCSALDLLSGGATFDGTGFVLSPFILYRELVKDYKIISCLERFLNTSSTLKKNKNNILIVATAATCLLQSHKHPNHNHPIDKHSAASRHARLLFENGCKSEKLPQYIRRTSSSFIPSEEPKKWYQKYYFPILVYVQSYLQEVQILHTLRSMEAIRTLEEHDKTIQNDMDFLSPSEKGWITFFQMLQQSDKLVHVCKDLNMTALGNKWFILFLTDLAEQSLEESPNKKERVSSVVLELRRICVGFFVKRTDPRTALEKTEEAVQNLLEHCPYANDCVEPLDLNKEGASPETIALELYLNHPYSQSHDGPKKYRYNNEHSTTRSISLSTTGSINPISVENIDKVKPVEDGRFQGNTEDLVEHLQEDTSTIKGNAPIEVGKVVADSYNNKKDIGKIALDITQSVLRQFPDTADTQGTISTHKQEEVAVVREETFLRSEAVDDVYMETAPSENEEVVVQNKEVQTSESEEGDVESSESDVSEEQEQHYYEKEGEDSGDAIEIGSSSEEGNEQDYVEDEYDDDDDGEGEGEGCIYEDQEESYEEEYDPPKRKYSSSEYDSQAEYEVDKDDEVEHVKDDDETVTRDGVSDQYEGETEEDDNSRVSGEYDSGAYESQEEQPTPNEQGYTDDEENEEHRSTFSVHNSSENEPMADVEEDYDDKNDCIRLESVESKDMEIEDEEEALNLIGQVKSNLDRKGEDSDKENYMMDTESKSEDMIVDTADNKNIDISHQEELDKCDLKKEQKSVLNKETLPGPSTETPQPAPHKEDVAYEADVSSREKSRKKSTFVAPTSRTRLTRNLEEEKAYEADVEIEEKIKGLPAPLTYMKILDDDSKESSSVTMGNSIQKHRIPGKLLKNTEIKLHSAPRQSAITCEDEAAYEADADTIDKSMMRSKYSKAHHHAKKTAEIEKEEQAYEADAELDGTDVPENMYKSKKHISNKTLKSGLEEKAYEADVEMDVDVQETEKQTKAHKTVEETPTITSYLPEGSNLVSQLGEKNYRNEGIQNEDSASHTNDITFRNEQDEPEENEEKFEEFSASEDRKVENNDHEDSVIRLNDDNKKGGNIKNKNVKKDSDNEADVGIGINENEKTTVQDGAKSEQNAEPDGDNEVDVEMNPAESVIDKPESSNKETEERTMKIETELKHAEMEIDKTESNNKEADESTMIKETELEQNAKLANDNAADISMQQTDIEIEETKENTLKKGPEDEGNTKPGGDNGVDVIMNPTESAIDKSQSNNKGTMGTKLKQNARPDNGNEADISMGQTNIEKDKARNKDMELSNQSKENTTQTIENTKAIRDIEMTSNDDEIKVNHVKDDIVSSEYSEEDVSKLKHSESADTGNRNCIDILEKETLKEESLMKAISIQEQSVHAKIILNANINETNDKRNKVADKEDLNEDTFEQNIEDVKEHFNAEKQNLKMDDKETTKKDDEGLEKENYREGIENNEDGALNDGKIESSANLDAETYVDENKITEKEPNVAIEGTNVSKEEKSISETIKEAKDLEAKTESKYIEAVEAEISADKNLMKKKERRSKRLVDSPALSTRSSARVRSRNVVTRTGLPPIVPTAKPRTKRKAIPKNMQPTPKTKTKGSKISSSSPLPSPSKSKPMKISKLPISPSKSPSPTKIRPMKVSTRSSSKRKFESGTPVSAKSTTFKAKNSSAVSVQSVGSSQRYSTRSRNAKGKKDEDNVDDESIASTIGTEHEARETPKAGGKISRPKNDFHIENIAFSKDFEQKAENIEPLSPPESKTAQEAGKKRSKQKKSKEETSVRSIKSTRSKRASARLRAKK